MNDKSEGAERTHSRDEVWKAIGRVAEQQAATESRISALETTVENGFRSLHSSIRQMSQPINWQGVAGLILGLLAMFGAYSVLVNRPYVQLQSMMYERQVKIEDRIADYGERIADQEARQEKTAERIEGIDTYGSGRWNDAPE